MNRIILSFFLIVFLSIPSIMWSQNNPKDSKNDRFGFRMQPLVLAPLFDPTDSYLNTEYEIEDSTMIFGAGIEIIYYFNEFFATGLGAGLEKVTQPGFTYIPIYLTTNFLLSKEFFLEA